jgi:iron complex transport system permease protein
LNYKRTRLIIILLQVFLGDKLFGSDFIGLAVPHIAKLVFRPVTTLYYFGVLCFCEYHICDSISQVPGGDITLPINAVTSVFGANSNLVAS